MLVVSGPVLSSGVALGVRHPVQKFPITLTGVEVEVEMEGGKGGKGGKGGEIRRGREKEGPGKKGK